MSYWGKLIAALAIVAAFGLGACGGNGAAQTAVFSPKGPISVTNTTPPCGNPPGIPTPLPGLLDYPPSGSTGVPTSLGQIIEIGFPGDEITVVSAGGNSVPLGAATSPPSPLPTPFVTPSPFAYGLQPYVAIPLPMLSPNTTYAVSDAFASWTNVPPCSTQVSQPMGQFTTGS